MRKVFADTTYWIALIDKNDQMHISAKHIANKINLVSIITSELILVELLNAFSGYGTYFRELSAKLVDKILESSQIKVISISSMQFKDGYATYKKYKDKDWSLVDCISFNIMSEENIEEVLSSDKHFAQAGFKTLLKIPS